MQSLDGKSGIVCLISDIYRASIYQRRLNHFISISFLFYVISLFYIQSV